MASGFSAAQRFSSGAHLAAGLIALAWASVRECHSTVGALA
jgi:hypothetical protein